MDHSSAYQQNPLNASPRARRNPRFRNAARQSTRSNRVSLFRLVATVLIACWLASIGTATAADPERPSKLRLPGVYGDDTSDEPEKAQHSEQVKVPGVYEEEITDNPPSQFEVKHSGLATGQSITRGEAVAGEDDSISQMMVLSNNGDLILTSSSGLDETRLRLMAEWSVLDQQAEHLSLLKDGELVLKNKSGKIVWRSNTAGLGIDRLVIDWREGMLLAGELPIWSTQRGRIEPNISGYGAPHTDAGQTLHPGEFLSRGEMLLSQQPGLPTALKLSLNGELGLYHLGWDDPVWKPELKPADKLTVTAEGGLDLLDGDGAVIWAVAPTRAGARLTFGSAGLSLIDSSDRVVWTLWNGHNQRNLTGPGAPHIDRGPTLKPGQHLTPGQMLSSRTPGVPVSLVMSLDGKFGLYSTGRGHGPWRIPSGAVATELKMLDTGHLILFGADGSTLWELQTSIPGAYLEIGHSRMSVRRPNGREIWVTDGTAEWRTGEYASKGWMLKSGEELHVGEQLASGPQHPASAWKNRGYRAHHGTGVRLVMHATGELALYQDYEAKKLWSSDTADSGAVKARFDSGNIDYINADGKVVARTTTRTTHADAMLQVDGRSQNVGMRAITPSGKLLWDTNGGFSARHYTITWVNLLIDAYKDKNNSQEIYGDIRVTPFGGAKRITGHNPNFWHTTSDEGSRVEMWRRRDFYYHSKQMEGRTQTYAVVPGPMLDYPGNQTQGVDIYVDLWDYDYWPVADDHFGRATRRVYFSEFDNDMEGNLEIKLLNDPPSPFRKYAARIVFKLE